MLVAKEVEGDPVDTLLEEKDLTKGYRHISVTIIEDVLHLPAYLEGEHFTRQVLQPLPQTTYLKDKFTGQEIQSNFLVSDRLLQSIRSFHKGHINHISTILGDFQFPSGNPRILAFFSGDQMHVLYTNQEGLKFYNKYKVKSPEDALYFLSAVYQLHSLDSQKIPLEIAGRCAKDSPIPVLLEKYFGELRFSSSSIHKSIGELKYHFFLDLFLTYQCG